MQDDILATISASTVRRLFGVGALMILGALLIYVAFLDPPDSFIWQIFLIVLGAGSLWLADKMRRVTLLTLILTRTDLRESDGTLLAEVDQITSVERGALAFKPSNGFMLHLAAPAPRRWRPGLWWRFGRRLGVGGVTSAAQTRQMADMLAVLIAER